MTDPSQSSNRADKPSRAEAEAACVRRVVGRVMQEERRLEAVKIDRERQALSVATLGVTNEKAVVEQVKSRLNALEALPSADACDLLVGESDCQRCPASDEEAGLPPMQVHRQDGVLTLERVTCPTAPRFWRWREVALPRLAPRKVTFHEEEDYDREWRLQLGAALACGALALGGWLMTPGVWSITLYLAAYVAGAWFTVGEIRERLQAGVLDIHFLMLAVAVGSAAIGAFGEGAVLLFLFSLSGALEHFAMGRTQREIQSLFRDAPKVAARLTPEGQEIPTPVEQLSAGMLIRVRPGEQFAVDAEVACGETASDESTLTGEAIPVDKRAGDTVLAGTLNLWGSVDVAVLRPAAESALQKVVRLIREAQHLKAPAQRFTDRFSTGYTYAVLGLSLAMFLYGWLIRGWPPWISVGDQASAFYRAMTLLVVASPCALVLSIPSAVLAAIAWAARRGILFRGGAAVERLAEIRVVAMDKTGTLTTGELKVEVIESFPPGQETEVGQWAFALEQLSEHPLARAITRHGKQQGWATPAVQRFESRSGLGVAGDLEERRVFLGRRSWIEAQTGWQPAEEPPLAKPGYSEIWLVTEGVAGRILLRDDVRDVAPQLIRALRKEELEVVVLTGDRPAAAELLRKQVGLQDIRAGLSPEDKVQAVHDYAKDGRAVAMIGDGVNDAPSLAAADVGVAMGARGADAALEQAEVILMKDRLENFIAAYRLSQKARRVIRQNLTLSLGTVLVLVTLATVGSIPLTVGVVGHEGSTVVVVLNSLRLLFARIDR